MVKPTIPIDNMSEEAFNKFKGEYLDSETLSGEALYEIIQIFGIGQSITGRICCDDYHRHNYHCNEYNRKDVAIVDRLVMEIKKYKNILNGIESKFDGIEKLINGEK
ncbi:hypothetical protein J4404_03435 [Candidatus Woesearchaeota archaeon]|nr:hypothetical protein [Candidatus Woesearchaeota archaeon]